MDAESNDAPGRARADAPDSRTRLSSSASSSSASSSAPDATLLAPVSFALRPSRARPGPLAHRTHHHPSSSTPPRGHPPPRPILARRRRAPSNRHGRRRVRLLRPRRRRDIVLDGVAQKPASTSVARDADGGPTALRGPSGNPTAFTSDAAADRRRAAEAAATRRARERRVATYAWGRCDAGQLATTTPRDAGSNSRACGRLFRRRDDDESGDSTRRTRLIRRISRRDSRRDSRRRRRARVRLRATRGIHHRRRRSVDVRRRKRRPTRRESDVRACSRRVPRGAVGGVRMRASRRGFGVAGRPRLRRRRTDIS